MNNLSSFTDVLGDEIENSQPISLPSSCSSLETRGNVTSSNNNITATERPAKGTGQYGEFRSIEEIDPKYRNIFSHSFFNVVQSRVIDDALYSDKSMVICAPTGSGKTVIFEMTIVQLLMSLDDKGYTEDFKIVYMAPVKALCTERLSEWYPKFTKLGLLCIEVTGDTDVDFSQLKPYRIIITTPEKWDMLTRRWRDHKSLVEVIKLFLIDEVHILNDETRGPVLEAVVSRMKTIESSVQSSHRIEQIRKQCEGLVDISEDPPRIRFVAVSATVSNPEDVATWLGSDSKPAVFYKFGDECRPVKLNRIVEGYPCSEGTSIFKFDIVLNYKLWPIIQKYHDGKPTLIFCNTRKSVVLTAETLSKELTINFNPEQRARLVELASTMKNKKLQSLIMSGVGCHHAGMLFEERMNIEQAFRNRDLPILITTTTLAMGVNLPAHLVIIKNTQQYVNGAYQEYSISTVLQMVGRAGRPQFDTEATAVIMTRLADKHRYQALVGGNEPLQSFLHKRLTENINSEAALGTVSDMAQCVQWLRSTFLFVRSARDPRRYLGLPHSAPQSLISKKIEELCVKAMNGLVTSGLITMDEASCIESTNAGRLMSIYYLDVETMKNIMKIDGTETLERLLGIVCDSHELSDMHLRVDERRCLNALNRNNTAATIRFPMKGKISTRQMKLNCMIQAVLGCLPIPDPSLNQEAMKVMRIADRICKCLVAYVTRSDLISQQPQYFSAILNSIILAKCVTAHLWENSPFVSKQLKGIGPTFSALLATAGKVNFMLLEESHPRDLERIMNKGPPTGNTLRKQISFLPKYHLIITPKNERTISIKLVLQNLCLMAENIEHLTAGEAHKAYVIVGDSDNCLLLLTSFKDKDLIRIYDGSITYEITRKRNCEYKIFVHCISSNFVGIDAQSQFTFQNLETPLYANTQTTKTLNQKQLYITDVFKERKRKNDNSPSKPQYKEKRRRDSSVLQKFNELKEPFNETFDMLNKNIAQTKMAPGISNNNMLPEIVCANNNKILDTGDRKSNTKNICGNNVINLSGPVVNIENSDEESLNDEKINSLLDKIESEICKENKIPKSHVASPKQTLQSPINNLTKGKSYFNTPQMNFHNDMNRQMTGILLSDLATQKNLQKTRKAKNLKNNYSFIDILEKNNVAIDNRDNTINTGNAIGFCSAIKSKIDKYLETIQRSSKDSDKDFNEILQNTEINDLPCVDLVQQGKYNSLGTDTLKSYINLVNNCELNSQQHNIDTEISIGIQDLDNIVKKNTLEKTLLIKSSQTDKFSPENDMTESHNLRNSNSLEEIIQKSSSSKENINDSHNEDNLLKPVSSIVDLTHVLYDPITNHGTVNLIDNNSDDTSNDHMIQSKEIAKKIEYQEQGIMEDKIITSQYTSSNQQIDFINSKEMNQLSRNVLKIESYNSLIDCISKYSFTTTAISVKNSPESLVHIIKKLKVNLDVSKTILCANKIINKYDSTTEKAHGFDKTYNSCSIKQNFKIQPSTIEAMGRRSESKHIEIQNVANASVNTAPKCITYYELKENQMEAILDLDFKKTVCHKRNLGNLKNTMKVNKCSNDDIINKDLPGSVDIDVNEDSNSNNSNETEKVNIVPQKCGADRVTDILQKYSTLLRRNTFNQDLNKDVSSVHSYSKRQETKTPDRPFRISDIQNLDVDIPQAFKSEISTNINKFVHSRFPIVKSSTQQKEKYVDVQILPPLNCAERTEHSIQVNKIEKSHKDNELEWIINMDESRVPDNEFNIHESMFDPKTLLQCLDHDNGDDIITPPPEFRDNESDLGMENLNEGALSFGDNNIFSDHGDLELTPCQEIEMWAVSPTINSNSFRDMDTVQTFITMNRDQPTDKRSIHNPVFSRRQQLNQFKFSNKKKMKI